MNISPPIRQRFFDDVTGAPLAGGQLFSYQAGTSIPQVTYSNSTGTPNTNPVVLDSNGYADVWLDPTRVYKFILEDSLGDVLWTEDNISASITLPATAIVGSAGSAAFPTAITASGGVSIQNLPFQSLFLMASGSNITSITANPQIQAGTTVGQRVLIAWCDSTYSCVFANGTGLIRNSSYTMVNGSVSEYEWDGAEWRKISDSVALGGSGGGGSLRWVEDANSPTPSVANHIQLYAFQSGLAQSLYALVKVPNGYAPGNPINLRIDFYSPDSSGSALMSSVATLIRQGTDAITSTTNQRTSTNAAVTLGAGTVNIPQSLALDLTDSTGKINSVAVSAGDYILVHLTRGIDTGTSDLQVPVYGAEVTFS